MTVETGTASESHPLTEDVLRLALPSKGRLLDPTLKFFESCGFAVKGGRGSRDYTASIPALPHCVVDLMAASEMPQRLADGEIHLAVTGMDLVSEMIGFPPASIDGQPPRQPETPQVVRRLGFGRADLVVAVPRAWIDVDSMADIAEVAQAYRQRHGRRMRIATKYKTLTRSFFSDHSVSDYRIVRSDGATEAAPASGVADIIVDITSTGATMTANHLKTLRDGLMLPSEASLFITGSPNAHWSPTILLTLRRLLDMVDAKTNASTRKMVLARLDGAGQAEAMARAVAELQKALSGVVDGEVEFGGLTPLPGAGHGLSVMLTAPAARLYEVVSLLRSHGAREVVVQDTDYVFDMKQSSFDHARAALGLQNITLKPVLAVSNPPERA